LEVASYVDDLDGATITTSTAVAGYPGIAAVAAFTPGGWRFTAFVSNCTSFAAVAAIASAAAISTVSTVASYANDVDRARELESINAEDERTGSVASSTRSTATTCSGRCSGFAVRWRSAMGGLFFMVLAIVAIGPRSSHIDGCAAISPNCSISTAD
jgi:hypothetical protein